MVIPTIAAARADERFIRMVRASADTIGTIPVSKIADCTILPSNPKTHNSRQGWLMGRQPV